MSIYHRGDEITIRDDLVADTYYPFEDQAFIDSPDPHLNRGLYFNSNMECYKGKSGRIREVAYDDTGDGIRYRISVDHECWMWSADMFLDPDGEVDCNFSIESLFGGEAVD